MIEEKEVKRVFITGVAGASGRYLVEWIGQHHPKVEIWGGCRRKGMREVPGVRLMEMDLLDHSSVLNCLQESLPQIIFHTAANPDKGFEIPAAILHNNVVGTANLFQAVGRIAWNPVVLNVSSSEVYGDVSKENVPIKETCPFRPVSPYGVSKAAQDNLAWVYWRAYGLRVVTTRAFTYINYLRPDLFMSSFAKQIAEIEAGKRIVLQHGNLDSVRVMMDAHDGIGAYWLAAIKGRPGEAYNIGGDVPVSVGEVLNIFKGLSASPVPSEVDPGLLRPVDVTLQIPDCSKFRKETGWSPKFNLTKSLKELLNYWRKKVQEK